MPGEDAHDRFELRHVGDVEWLIHDHNYSHDDARHVVAHLAPTDGDVVEVTWLQTTALPTQYATPRDVIDDLIRWKARTARGTRPIPIPHFPPFPGDRLSERTPQMHAEFTPSRR